MLAPRIARLATRNHVTLRRLAATDNRYEMIHGQIRRRELAAAMVANTARNFPLPPLAPAQLARHLPLAAHVLFGNFDEKWSGVH